MVQVGGLAPGPVWTGAENLPLLGFDTWTIKPTVRHNINYTNRLPNIIIYLFSPKFPTPPANSILKAHTKETKKIVFFAIFCVGTEGRYNLFGSTLNANKCVLICG
jgi:hypothetical protein